MEIVKIIVVVMGIILGMAAIGLYSAFMLSSQISREEEERGRMRVDGQDRSFAAPGKHRRAQDDK